MKMLSSGFVARRPNETERSDNKKVAASIYEAANAERAHPIAVTCLGLCADPKNSTQATQSGSRFASRIPGRVGCMPFGFGIRNSNLFKLRRG